MRVWWGSACAVLGSLLALVAVTPAAGEDEGTAPWRDPSVLARHLDAACSAVEAVCEHGFYSRPGIRVSTQEELHAVLRGGEGSQAGMLESSPDESRSFIAYYDPLGKEVHILPEAMAKVAGELGVPGLLEEDVLRVILVHEATHALDFERFETQWMLACCADSDERLAHEAVLEGHAQMVSEEVAKRWDITPAFQRLTKLYTGALERENGEEAEGLDQEAAFSYIQGHAFIRAIQAARGREGVNAVLKDPPFETRVIDRPILWLEPARRVEEVDLQALLDVFLPLVPAPDWEVSKWRVLGPGVPLLPQAPGETEESVESYVDNHGLYAGTPGGNRYFNVFVAYCRSERHAERFLAALRGVDEARDENPGWTKAVRHEGAGPENKLYGFSSRRRMVAGGPNTELTLQVIRQGRYVVELSAYGLEGVKRKDQDSRLYLADRLLRATPPSAAAVALRAHVKAFLTARELGRLQQARELMRALLPSRADLRRVVRPRFADEFADRYRGLRIALRTTPILNATIFSAFQEAAPNTLVRAWAATSEQLCTGEGWAAHFPEEMRVFSCEMAAPGMTWIVLSLTTPKGDTITYPCFVRFGDRFLWVKNPWEVEVPR